MAGLQADLVLDVVSDVFKKHGLQQDVALNVFDLPVSIGGSNIAMMFQERAGFSRAAMKRPDILILNQSLAGHDAESLQRLRDKVSELLPETTQIYMDSSFANPDDFDMYIKIRGGRIDGLAQVDVPSQDDSISDDLRRKLRIIARNDLFGNLDPRNQRLLAFAAQWYTVAQGEMVFAQDQRPDAVYLCLSGKGELSWRDPEGLAHHVSTVEKGRLIGDLAVIVNEPRQMDFVAVEDSRFLRIGADQFKSVVENDRVILLSLLRTVSSHLTNAADLLRAARVDIPREDEALPPPVGDDPA